MDQSPKTPGVYINELPAFPTGIVAAPTALPVFIGYTEKAAANGESLLRKLVRITSLAEYCQLFGGGFQPVFTLAPAAGNAKGTVMVNGQAIVAVLNGNNTAYLYNSLRLFFVNGGSECFILSVGTYGDKPDGFTISIQDYMGTGTQPGVLTMLENEAGPTLVLAPDIIALGTDAYSFYGQVLQHCGNVQSRFGIFDTALQQDGESMDDVATAFRDSIGSNYLAYGASYYPWLCTTIVAADELSFENLDAGIDLATLLPEPAAQQVATDYAGLTPEKRTPAAKATYNINLLGTSPTYTAIMALLRQQCNVLPPCGAIAGIYCQTDNTHGVWKAPANVSVAFATQPTQPITDQEQQELCTVVMSGKAINPLRAFAGMGTTVWGARTLDGNSQDWRYINVRRTVIMIEQSIKMAMRGFVFEPNTATTWAGVSSMVNDFLNQLWKQGALAGAGPDQAYSVSVGLGSTMTADDILKGIMRVSVLIAIVRPAEFIVLTMEQQMQTL